MRQGTTWTGQKVKYKGPKIEPCGMPLLFDSYLIWMELVRSIGNSDILLQIIIGTTTKKLTNVLRNILTTLFNYPTKTTDNL